METTRKLFTCGLDIQAQVGTDLDFEAAQRLSTENGFNFVSVPISQPRSTKDLLSYKSNLEDISFTKFNHLTTNQDLKPKPICKIGDYYDVDSEDASYRKISETIFKQEIGYVSYINLMVAMVKVDARPKPNLSRLLFGWLSNPKTDPGFSIWIHVPMMSQDSIHSDTWHWWNCLRLMCNSERRLGVALEVTADLPTDKELTRWFGEPLKMIVLPTSLFINNEKGYPVLPEGHRNLVLKFASHNVKLLLTGSCRHSSIRHYYQYLDFIIKSCPYMEDSVSDTNSFEESLQYPLQPLADNLQSSMYDSFEKDPVKYREYGRAIYQALVDRVKDNENNSKIQVVMIVGAGRGPLVNTALSSANRAGRKIKCYAVEKNPHALLTLLTLKNEVWGDKVEVVGCDMRDWNPPEKCDLLVSELLGSFGDNELSPECLDGAQKYLKEDGISIPCKYTSYLCPTQSSTVFNAAIATAPMSPLNGWETAHVVDPVSSYMIAKTQPLFTFEHPNKDAVTDNRRYSVLKFKAELDCVLYGFIGYFDAILYGDIKISIVPETYSKGMFSWSPLFFPIKDPFQIKKDQVLEVHFWRLSDKKNVWYEWSITKPTIVSIHNPNGRFYSIGLR